MKTIVFIFLMSGIALPAFTQINDSVEIRKVIEAEDRAFYTDKDRLAHARYWQIIPETRWWYSGLEYTEFWTGEDYTNAIKTNNIPPADNAVCTFSEFTLKASGNIGWATYDKKTVTPAGKTEYTHEFRGMEKIKSVWKIVSASVHQYKPKE